MVLQKSQFKNLLKVQNGPVDFHVKEKKKNFMWFKFFIAPSQDTNMSTFTIILENDIYNYLKILLNFSNYKLRSDFLCIHQLIQDTTTEKLQKQI